MLKIINQNKLSSNS